jgi:multidrug efflux system outer membrane protein
MIGLRNDWEFRPLATACLAVALCAALTAAGCKVGPDYVRPAVEVPVDWRFKTAEPQDHVPKGEWWIVFNDSQLNELQGEALAYNQDLKAAAARVDQARAAARIKRSDFFPTLQGTARYSDYRTSGNSPSPLGFPIEGFNAQQWDVPFDLSYEVDVWGKIRRSFEGAQQMALSAEAARQNVLLILQADVAVHYFGLVGAAAEIEMFQRAIDIRQEALDLFKLRLEVGVGSEFEVERTRAELAIAKADLGAAQQRQAQLQNALAVLCGRPPSGFAFPKVPTLAQAPHIAPNLPSTLLERRPDVAEAERQMAARNSQIGVTKAAFFPSVRLTAYGGFQSADLSDLFTWESRVWGVSPSVTMPIFEGGRIKADVEQAQAVYDEAVANYRQRILVAFREVEDNLAAIRFLREQVEARSEAVDAATKSVKLATDRYTAGTINFLEVIDAETIRLQNAIAQIRISTDQLNATVRLIKAMGGGWDEPLAKNEIEP